jgi:hypothetical protein
VDDLAEESLFLLACIRIGEELIERGGDDELVELLDLLAFLSL